MEPARRRATMADIDALPEHVTGEIVEGELYTSARPLPLHAQVGLRLSADVDLRFGRGDGAWLFLPEVEVRLGDAILVPDVAGWRPGRFASFPEHRPIDVAPDWVCEVLSPSTRTFDFTKKTPLYAAHGAVVWLVEPRLREVQVVRAGPGGQLIVDVHEDVVTLQAPPFDVPLDASAWWPPPTRPASP